MGFPQSEVVGLPLDDPIQAESDSDTDGSESLYIDSLNEA